MTHPLSPGTHHATLNGAALVYHVHGSGPVLVALAGGPGFSWHYLRMPAVEAHATIVYLELVGTGASARLPAAHYGRARDVADVEALRVHLGLDRIGLLGHSAGGFVAHRVSFDDDGACRVNWFGQCTRRLDPPGEMGGLVGGGRNLRTIERSAYLRANLTYRLATGHSIVASFSPEFDVRETESDTAAGPLTGDATRRMFVLGAAYDYALAERLENSFFLKMYSQRMTADEFTFGTVVTRSRSNSRSSRSCTTSMCSRPRKPQRKPKPSAVEVSGS